MKFDMGNLNPPAWFYFDDSDPSQGKVLLRVCSGTDLDDINRKTSKKQPPEYRRGNRYEIPDKVDEKRRAEMLWDFMIVDWEGVLDQNGYEIKCTPDNKNKLMRESVAFATFIASSLDKLTADITKYQEEVEKNSLSSQNE